MQAQRKLLDQRYNLQANLDPQAKMSCGKPFAVGPTARLAQGVTRERLAQMKPEEISAQGLFPYPTLPHPLQSNGGQVFHLHTERFLKNEPPDGPIKAFTLRGTKDGPPYLHDGRYLTLEDTAEFFNLVLQLRLTPQEKTDVVEFMRQL